MIPQGKSSERMCRFRKLLFYGSIISATLGFGNFTYRSYETHEYTEKPIVKEYVQAQQTRRKLGPIKWYLNQHAEAIEKLPYVPEEYKKDLEEIANSSKAFAEKIGTIDEKLESHIHELYKKPEFKEHRYWMAEGFLYGMITALVISGFLALTYPYEKIRNYVRKKK